jgi:hypothetical protein
MRKFIAVVGVVFFSLAAVASPAKSKAAAIHQLLQLLGNDDADEGPGSRFAAFDRNMTEAQVSESVSFLASATGRQLLAGLHELTGVEIGQLNAAMARSKMKRSMADIRSLATALEARATDENSYPSVKTLAEVEKLVSPTYIRVVSRLDAWGHELFYTGGGDHYRLVSAGPDGKFSEASRKMSAKSGFGDDIVYEDGVFLAPTDQE